MNNEECVYCNQSITDDNYLDCTQCQHGIHVNCLKRPGTPGDIFGDVFFTFTCCNCSENGKEQFIRIPLPWTIMIILAIYNLSINSKGLSLHGYFHWQTHIIYFIEKNWNYLVGQQNVQTRRKKQIRGIVSGALSRQSPQLFLSAADTIGQTGWWKLTHNQTPKWYMKLYNQLKEEKRKDEDVDVCSDQVDPVDVPESKRFKLDDADETFSRTMPYMGRRPVHLKQTVPTGIETVPSSTAQEELADFLESNMSSIEMMNDFANMSPSNYPDDAILSTTNDFDWSDIFTVSPKKSTATVQRTHDYEPRIVEVTNFQEIDDTDLDLSTTPSGLMANIKTEVVSDADDSDDDDDDQDYDLRYRCEKSLFNVTQQKRPPPWEYADDVDNQLPTVDDYISHECKDIQLMSEYEERSLLERLKQIIKQRDRNNEDVPAWVRRFYRKLCVRETKKSLNQPIFDIDGIKYQVTRGSSSPQILDRFNQLLIASSCWKDTKCGKSSFYATLAGVAEYDLFESPNTGRILHPFIYRDSKSIPQWVKLMCELQYTVNGDMPSRAPIDYCYLRPHHIAAVNSLLQKSFWHGIDMSECLTYPDFTCVALYKKLVVGCAFLVPDVGHNEAYVSFMAVRSEWQRAGIATFMLYHLIQTCISRDITLHVSATNPAICLYQKFGFKIEGFILDFYDKYLPFDSKHSRHAFFLRMKR